MCLGGCAPLEFSILKMSPDRSAGQTWPNCWGERGAEVLLISLGDTHFQLLLKISPNGLNVFLGYLLQSGAHQGQTALLQDPTAI